MEEGISRAREILHAQEQFVFLRGCRHEKGFRVALAGLQCNSRVAHLATEKKTFKIHERLIDHNGLDLGCPVHPIFGVGTEIAMGGLLDILKTLEVLRLVLLDTRQEFQDIFDVLAAFVEVG